MKKFILLILFVLPLLSAGNSDTKVYICTGKNSYAYHCRIDCRGLKNCKAEVKTVTITEAQELKRKPCGYCYR